MFCVISVKYNDEKRRESQTEGGRLVAKGDEKK